MLKTTSPPPILTKTENTVMKIIDIFGHLKQGKPILYNNDDLRLNVF